MAKDGKNNLTYISLFQCPLGRQKLGKTSIEKIKTLLNLDLKPNTTLYILRY